MTEGVPSTIQERLKWEITPALYQRIRSRLGIRTGGGVIGREGAAESGGEREGGEQRGDPRREHHPTAAEGELTEACEP